MPRPYKRYYGAFDTREKVKKALECILNGDSVYRASVKTGLSHYTIKKYFYKYKSGCEIFNQSQQSLEEDSLTQGEEVNRVFTKEQEIELTECFKYVQSLFFGLFDAECRILAYQKAVKDNLTLPDSWKLGMADADWLLFFKNMYPRFSIERAQRCFKHTHRGGIWEKKYINTFYDDLEKLIQTNPVLFKNSARIFCLDETYTNTNLIIKAKNEGSKGDIITTCCIISANGTSLPPIKFQTHNSLEDDINPSISLERRECISTELFPVVMEHFINHSNSSLDNPSILIMDIDLCHMSLEAFDLAKTFGVHFITLHPHVSKKLQPLEMGMVDSFHSYVYASLESFLAQRDGSEEDDIDFDIDKIISDAYAKAMTPENIRNAFKKCGIVPFDRDLFTDSEYQECVIIDPPCFDCRARYERSKKFYLIPVDDTDENACDGTSNDSRVNRPENRQNSSQTLKGNQNIARSQT